MTKLRKSSKKSVKPLASKAQGKLSGSNPSGKREEKSVKKKELNASRLTLNAKEPSTMSDLLASVGDVPVVRGFRKGQVVTGTVSSIAGKEVLIDFGGKMEGVVGQKEWEQVKDFVAKLKVGDKIEAVVISPENVKAQMIVSIKRAGGKARWKRATDLLTSGEAVNIRGVEVNKGGLIVDFEGVRGFVPGSQLTIEHQAEINRMVNRTFSAKVIEVDQPQNRLIFSERAVTAAGDLVKKLEELKSKIKIGEKYAGKVSAIMAYGIFVNLDNGADGLVHISEVSWAKVDDLNSLYKVGDRVEIKVLGISEADGKLNLSIKQLLPDPWSDLSKKYSAEQEVEGKVTRVSAYGVFVELEDGIEGLIHISKVPSGKVFEPGEDVTCTIESVDTSAHRISLLPVLKAKPIGYK